MEFITIPVTRFRQNCSLLMCTATGRGAIVDPGGDIDAITDAIATHGVTIEKILLTHGHLDHAGGTAELQQLLSVSVEGPHQEDRFLLDGLVGQGERYGVTNVANFTPDRWLEEGDTVSFGEQALEVFHCPGHTPGHIVFFNRTARLAAVGDVLFMGSVGRTDLPRGNHEQLVESIRGKLFPLGDDIRFIPGHGDTSTFGWERKCNPYVADLMFD